MSISLRFLTKKKFEHHIDQLISNVLITYFDYNKFSQIFYSIYHKFNGAPNGCIMELPYSLNLLFYMFM